MEVTLPEYPQKNNDVSFHLAETETKTIMFQSRKSHIQRDKKLKEIDERKLKKNEKGEGMEKNKKENLGIEIDEETFLGIIMSVLLGTKSSHSTSR